MSAHIPEALVIQPTPRIVARLGVALLLCALAPSRAAAQSAERVADDAPSRNRETHVQHDSLAVHFLRAPKAKPAARTTGGAPDVSSAKFRGRPAPVATSAPVATPLPTKRKSPKQ
ncbi:MAG: hypothetical protein U5K74_01945 [Gemmatimonadaceae bacterium]|nr:hypothetical protein [Gemmatimonadaceae bacterium]